MGDVVSIFKNKDKQPVTPNPVDKAEENAKAKAWMAETIKRNKENAERVAKERLANTKKVVKSELKK